MKRIVETADQIADTIHRLQLFLKGNISKSKLEVVIQKPSKSRDMEKKYHAMINDIAAQVTFYKGKKYSAKIWKAQLIEQFAEEKRLMGEPLSNDVETTSSLDGLRTITIRPSSTEFRVQEGSDFIEHLYATGAEYGVVWTDRALRAYEQYRESQ